MLFDAGHQLSHTYRALLRSYLLEPSPPQDTHPSPSVVMQPSHPAQRRKAGKRAATDPELQHGQQQHKSISNTNGE